VEKEIQVEGTVCVESSGQRRLHNSGRNRSNKQTKMLGERILKISNIKK
jgi:hypothetical protein